MSSFAPLPSVGLAAMTTMGVGGAAEWFAELPTVQHVQDACRWAADRGLPLTVMAGGSNLVVSDRGVPGLVVRVAIPGVDLTRDGGALRASAGAGVRWDALVAEVAAAGGWGTECLSGIPGSVGATPVQNVGAYGQEVSQSVEAVEAIDRRTAAVVEWPVRECAFGYRTSRFRSVDRDRYIIVGVRFAFGREAGAYAYPDLTRALAVGHVQRPTPVDVREAVLGIRRAKGMVVDPADPDTRSAGSFFLNPVMDRGVAERLPEQSAGEAPPVFAADAGRVKVPAAWLIERAGGHRGMVAGRAGLSTRHTLAIINRGGATSDEIVDLAVSLKRRVVERFGVWLTPEPVFAGFGDDERMAFLQRVED
ncbi:MAG: UDP-N-acetylmuramate dehydrogenase [Vicinamibacterales bacterium]|nr:UDP-N-acetylmuramate dehydrogenase [Vicinamibacterales bacterium]